MHKFKQLFSGPTILLLGIIAIGVLMLAFGQANSPTARDGSSDAERIALAQCLTENDAVFYGAWWCPHCDNQKRAFGTEAVDELNYVECSTADRQMLPVCQEAGIQSFPTWDVAGERLTGEISLLRLARLAGCPYLDFDPNEDTADPLEVSHPAPESGPASDASSGGESEE